jgi:hypothetical protein
VTANVLSHCGPDFVIMCECGCRGWCHVDVWLRECGCRGWCHVDVWLLFRHSCDCEA